MLFSRCGPQSSLCEWLAVHHQLLPEHRTIRKHFRQQQLLLAPFLKYIWRVRLFFFFYCNKLMMSLNVMMTLCFSSLHCAASLCACWQTPMGIISVRLQPKMKLLMTISIQRLLWIQMSLKSHSVTTKVMGLNAARCWMTHMSLWKTVRNIMTPEHTKHMHIYMYTVYKIQMSAFISLYCVLSSVKPNSPCCLTVTQNSRKHHFTWKSTYEEYRSYSNLINNLKYQLHYYKRQDKDKVRLHFFFTGKDGNKRITHAFKNNTTSSAATVATISVWRWSVCETVTFFDPQIFLTADILTCHSKSRTCWNDMICFSVPGVMAELSC